MFKSFYDVLNHKKTKLFVWIAVDKISGLTCQKVNKTFLKFELETM